MTLERPAIVAARLDSLRDLMGRRGADAMLLSTRRSFSWATLGGLSHVLLSTDSAVAPLVVTRHDALVVAPVNEYARLAEEELADLPLRVVSVPWWDGVTEAAVARLTGAQHVLSEIDAATELEMLRTALVPAEHRRLEALSVIVRDAAHAALAPVRAGDTEHSIAAAAANTLAKAGARLPVILVAADERIDRYRHPLPTQRPVSARVMIVIVAECWGLHVAHTEFRNLHDDSAKDHERAAALALVLGAMRDATRPGNTLGDVLAAARAAYAAAGLEQEWQLHHQGGTIGYAARERIAVPGDATPIRPGMAFAWNPSRLGHKLEETLYLDETGEPHVLTSTPR